MRRPFWCEGSSIASVRGLNGSSSCAEGCFMSEGPTLTYLTASSLSSFTLPQPPCGVPLPP
eukprot:1890302-Pleurochrysis_carterae.AAC.1